MSKQTGSYTVALTPATGTTGGSVVSLANPEGQDLIVTKVVLQVDTPSSGAGTVDAGIAANGTTSADNLIDGQDMNAAAGCFANLGSNGKRAQKWGSSQYFTITPSATMAGLVGFAHIEYIRAA